MSGKFYISDGWTDRLAALTGIDMLFHCFRFTLKRYVMDGIQLNIPEFPKSYVDELQYSKFIPCNLKSARKFYSKYGYDNGADAATFRLTAKNLLSLAKNVLDELGVQFWLSSGTCLGKCKV